MKILLITNPRTGSTYFGSSLAKTYDIPFINEPPFLEELNLALNMENGYIVKVVIPQLYWYYYDDIESELHLSKEESINEFYKLISEYKFDNIILLDRKNEEEFIDAMINLLSNRAKQHDYWIADDNFKKHSLEERDKRREYVHICKDWMQSVSEKFNIPIIYYEDLYYDTNIVDLQGLEFKPDLSKRLRRNISII